MAGMSRLHTDAATITPAAKPVRERWTTSLRERRMKNTQAAPRDVPKNGIKSPKKVAFSWEISVTPFTGMAL